MKVSELIAKQELSSLTEDDIAYMDRVVANRTPHGYASSSHKGYRALLNDDERIIDYVGIDPYHKCGLSYTGDLLNYDITYDDKYDIFRVS